MSWVRIHDGALTHPKIVGLIDWRNPFCVWVWGLSYSQCHLTEGAIPSAAVPHPKAKRAIEQLVASGCWEATSSGWQVHDYLDWNDSRELVQQRRLEAKERMANARARRSQEVRANFLERTSPEVPLRVGVGSSSGSSKKERKKDDLFDARFGDFWAAYPRKEGKQKALEAWRNLKPDNQLAARIIESVHVHMEDSQWQKDRGQFVPFPATFLNQGRFDDEPNRQSQVSEPTSRLAQAVKDFSHS